MNHTFTCFVRGAEDVWRQRINDVSVTPKLACYREVHSTCFDHVDCNYSSVRYQILLLASHGNNTPYTDDWQNELGWLKENTISVNQEKVFSHVFSLFSKLPQSLRQLYIKSHQINLNRKFFSVRKYLMVYDPLCYCCNFSCWSI